MVQLLLIVVRFFRERFLTRILADVRFRVVVDQHALLFSLQFLGLDRWLELFYFFAYCFSCRVDIENSVFNSIDNRILILNFH